MSDVEITVRGSHREFHPAERGTVHAHVAFEGADAEQAYDNLVRTAEQVHRSVTTLHDPAAGPVTWWSTKDVRTWAQRPWNQDGKQLPLVHHARLELEVKFSNFASLSRWLGEVSELAGFSVQRVDWTLTERMKTQLAQRARTGAVQAALSKAVSYADALGLGTVRALEIADAGMLGDQRRPEGDSGAPMMRAAAFSSPGEPELKLLPEDIEITASVDGRFIASA